MRSTSGYYVCLLLYTVPLMPAASFCAVCHLYIYLYLFCYVMSGVFYCQWMANGEHLAVGLIVLSLVVVVYKLESDHVTVPHHLGVVQIV